MWGSEGHRQVARDHAVDIAGDVGPSRSVNDSRPAEAGPGQGLLEALRLVGAGRAGTGAALRPEIGLDQPIDVVVRDGWDAVQSPRSRAGRVMDDQYHRPARLQGVVHGF